MRADPHQRGFSLVEVATSIGVIAFALVALLGVFPLGLENSRLTVGDTRATQIVKTISATLQSETFTAAECFAPEDAGMAKLDYTKLPATEPANGGLSKDADAVLYASYDVTNLPRLVRATATTIPADAIYRVELRFRRERFTPLVNTGASTGVGASTPAPRVAGTNVNLRIFGAREKGDKRKPFSESWTFIPNITRP